jgi:hypothetical protein
MYVRGVKVSQSTTTTVTVPQAGVVTIVKPASGPISIYSENGGKMEWVCNLDINPTQHTVVMQPGFYHAIYRVLSIKSTIYTIDKVFEVKPAVNTTVELE